MFQYDGKPVKKWSGVLASARENPMALASTGQSATGTAMPAGSRSSWSRKSAGTMT